jgi:glycosyltransferase involved in cell wall biosynthesis
VIVPARNEDACLGGCLQSLAKQTGVPLEIIVVDDHSTDRTREIALSFSDQQVRVIEAGPLPPGWTGKNNAVTAGSKAAAGEWLLFTDADTIHLPGSLARSLEEAKRHGASLLSYSPEQIVKSFWEKAIMPVIFAELAASYRPSQVSDPDSPAAAANGQYILIARCSRKPARRRSSGPNRKTIRQKNILPLRRRCGPNPHVSQLRPTPRRLDQEPRALISRTGKTGRIARNRVRPDRSQRSRSYLRRSARTRAIRRRSWNPRCNSVRAIPQANPPRAFLLGCKPPGRVRPPSFFLFPDALKERARNRHGSLEGPQVF